jgi:hypothetical protein
LGHERNIFKAYIDFYIQTKKERERHTETQ